MPSIKSIAYKPEGLKDSVGAGTARVALQEATLVEGYGIQGDRKGGNPKRNLNVMDDLTLAELAAEGYPTTPRLLGENLILSGIDLRTLPTGTQLQLGPEAVIEVGKARVPCEQLTPLDERMPDQVHNRVGMMCRVLRSGKIKVGDPVAITAEKIAAVDSQ